MNGLFQDSDIDDPTSVPGSASDSVSSSNDSFTTASDLFLREMELNSVSSVPHRDSDSEDNGDIEVKNNKKRKIMVNNGKTGKIV